MRPYTGQVQVPLPPEDSHLQEEGFTEFNSDEFEGVEAGKRLIPDDCGIKYIHNHGPLDKQLQANPSLYPPIIPISCLPKDKDGEGEDVTLKV